MDKALIIQLVIIFIVLIFAFVLLSIVSTFRKEKRINDFAMSKKVNNELPLFERLYIFFWKRIHNISNKLGKSKIILNLATNYEKYILTTEENYKSSIDYITIKILSTIVSIILEVVLTISEIIPNNIIILILFIIIGYILPDIFWKIAYLIKCQNINSRIYESIIIISDVIENTNIYNAIKIVINKIDGPIKDEYNKILIDLSYNIPLDIAYKRFYERTKLSNIKVIYNILDINSDDLVLSFNQIRNQLFYLDKQEKSKTNINRVLEVMSFVYLLIPLVFLIMILIVNPNYFVVLTESFDGYVLFFIVILLYLLLAISINKIMEDRN